VRGSHGAERGRGRAEWAVLAATMAAVLLLLLWEGRGLTFFVDEWSFGYGFRTGHDLSAFLAPDNGHLALVPVLITKASLQLFGATTALPLRLVSVAAHLSVGLFFFLLVRRSIGGRAALVPTVLVLFFGVASDLLVGSHGMPMLIAVAAGLGSWIALGAGTRSWDAVASGLLVVGVASNGLALPFLAGAAAIIVLAPAPARRLWIPALPLLLYVAWRLAYGDDGQSEFAFANIAGLPAFAFDSLGAELAAITGLFTEVGAERQSFNPQAGEALAGAVIVAGVAFAVLGRWRLPRATIPPAVALLCLWILTGMVASPARQPVSARYLYAGAILILLAAAAAIGTSPLRRRASLAMIGVCAVGLLPNLREIDYGATFFREQSNQDKAVLGAADLLPASVSGATPVEVEAEETGDAVADMRFSLGSYRAAAARFGSPAYSLEQLEAADAASREVADRFLGRALATGLLPATGPPSALPAGIETDVEAGEASRRGGCVVFEPQAPGAWLTIQLPPGGLWIRPQTGPEVPVALRRFGDGFPVAAGAPPGGRPSVLPWTADSAGQGWEAQLAPQQPILVCGR
jgi:hypothetical protein